MIEYFKYHWTECKTECVGLAFFLAWVYCTLFGCGLVTTSFIHWGIESIWSAAGLAGSITAVVFLAFQGHAKMPTGKLLGVIGAAFAVAGCIAIWLGYFDHRLFVAMRTVGGICCGIAIVCMTSVWYARLSMHNEADIEFAVPFSFALSFAIYCIILLVKVSAVPVLVLDCLFPILSMRYALNSTCASLDENLRTTVGEKHSSLREYASLLVLIGFLWFQIAYFRVISTPEEIGDRYLHFLIPFFGSCVIASILFLSCIKVSRHVNFTLIIRWPLPLFMLSYVVYFLGYQDQTIRTIAYAVNFIGMFGVQLGCWMAAPKYLRRTKESPIVMALGIIAAQGAGIFVGFTVSIYVLARIDTLPFAAVSLVIMTVVLAVSMLVGFNPRWYFNRMPAARTAHDQSTATGTQPVAVIAQDELDALFADQAFDLQKTYGLTDRETEVAALLLAGRTRPYIRDELIISLNTVHAHVRRIFVKCDVHSQQELLDLARTGTSNSDDQLQRENQQRQAM